MRIVQTNVYVGPNLYAHFPVIRHTIRLGPLEDWPTGRLGRSFVNALVEALPGLQEHGCSYGERGGFLRRMTEGEGTWLGHVWEHVALEIQNLAAQDVTFGKTRSTRRAAGEYFLIYQYRDRETGLEAGELARRLLLSLLPDEPAAALEAEDRSVSLEAGFDWVAERDAYIRTAQRYALGPSTLSLVEAAERRGIPWLRLNKQSLIQFGHGKYQRRIQATITSETRHIAVELSSDKEETRTLLSSLGLPFPKQSLVYGPEAAVEAAEAIGYPVVVKPLDANHGRGVSIRLMDADAVRAGFDMAREHGKSRGVLVESFVEGFDHRMLVVNGRLIAVAKRVPGHVVGDGAHTIAQLVEITNADPRRGVGHEKVLTRLVFDAQAERLLEKAGLTPETVLPEGETFFLRSTGNISTGGTAVDLTDQCHPDNRAMAERAVRALGLDVGGVDFLSPDVTKSYRDVGGAIVEVNAAPGFRMHVAPSEGRPRDVAGPVLDMLFPVGSHARIPIAAITGTNGKTTTTRMLAHIVKMAGYTPGMTSTDGVFVDERLTVKGDMTGPSGARMVLRDPYVDAAVLEVARGGLVRSGLGFRQCDVACCLNVTEDHLGLGGIDTLDELALVKRIPIEVATDTAVLNADDERVLAMRDHTRADRVCLVTMRQDNEAVRRHVRRGRRAVVLERGMGGDMITLYDGGRHLPLLWTHLIPATLEGKAWHNVQNAMFAAGLAYALGEGPLRDGPFGLSLDHIRHGLRTFTTSFYEAPGRLNVFDEHPFRVILDYAHNPAAIQVMVDLVDQLDVDGRKLAVLSAPGDRRDEDIRAIARIAAGHFDHFVVRRDDNARGRGPEEVPEMLRASLLEAGVAEDAVELIADEEQATEHALRLARHGDLLVLFADAVARTWRQVVRFDSGPGRARRTGGDGATEAAQEGGRPAPTPTPPRRPPTRRTPPPCPRSAPRSASSTPRATRRRTDVLPGRGRLEARGPGLPSTRPPPLTPNPMPPTARRLTGPGPLLDGPGAVLDVLGARVPEAAVQAWTDRAAALASALGWRGRPAVTRFSGGAALAVPAPIDQLYTATALVEAAWAAAEAAAAGAEPPPLDAQVGALQAAADAEARPALIALEAAARAHDASILWDDDAVSIGLGAGSTVWSTAALPPPDAVEWGRVQDVPVALVTGTNGKTTTVRMLAAILRAAGHTAAVTTTDYIAVGGDVLDTGDCSGPGSARLALRDRRTTAAALEVARGGLLRRGLPVPRATAAAVLNVDADHLGEYGVESVEELAAVKFSVHKALGPSGVLVTTAEEPLCAREAARLRPALEERAIRLALTALPPDHPTLAAHDGPAAAVVAGHLAYRPTGDADWAPAVPVADVPAALGGAAAYNVRNALAALVLARAMGVGEAAVAAGLRAFRSDPSDNPGRTNRFTLASGAEALVDFAHNAHGLDALGALALRLPARRRLVLLGQPGDRRDPELQAFARAAARLGAERYVVVEVPEYLRGRPLGETSAVLHRALREAGVGEDRIVSAPDPTAGVRLALDWAGPGDFLLLPILSQRTQVLGLLAVASAGAPTRPGARSAEPAGAG